MMTDQEIAEKVRANILELLSKIKDEVPQNDPVDALVRNTIDAVRAAVEATSVEALLS